MQRIPWRRPPGKAYETPYIYIYTAQTLAHTPRKYQYCMSGPVPIARASPHFGVTFYFLCFSLWNFTFLLRATQTEMKRTGIDFAPGLGEDLAHTQRISSYNRKGRRVPGCKASLLNSVATALNTLSLQTSLWESKTYGKTF